MAKQIRWNRAFTSLIRNTRPAYWGNWSLNTQVKPGAVGRIVEGENFQLLQEPSEKVSVKDQPTSSTWALSSESVSRNEGQVNFDGGVVDPETQTEVNVGLEVKWGFSETGSVVSEFSVAKESYVENVGAYVEENISDLIKVADQNGMATGESIHQGFGIITSVIWASSGLNVGAQESNSSFGISGSVEAVNKMVGKASGKGSYNSTSQDKSMDKHLWPDKANILAEGLIPIAFTFASFEGKTLIQNWITRLHGFSLTLENNHGGSYVVYNTLTYDTPSGPIKQENSVSGGLTNTFSNIPLDATNVNLEVLFDGVSTDVTFPFHWEKPLGDWLTGQRHLQLHGFWPGDVGVKVQETGYKYGYVPD